MKGTESVGETSAAGFVFVITSGVSGHPGYYVIGGSH